MSKLQWIPVCLLTVFTVIMSVSGASAMDYTIKWVNNMNYSSSIGNADGYCTDIKAELLDKKGVTIGSKVYSGNLKVQDATTMIVSTPLVISSSCRSMKLSGTCTYKAYRNPTKTDTTTQTVACASGKAVFLIQNFGLIFYPGAQ